MIEVNKQNGKADVFADTLEPSAESLNFRRKTKLRKVEFYD